MASRLQINSLESQEILLLTKYATLNDFDWSSTCYLHYCLIPEVPKVIVNPNFVSLLFLTIEEGIMSSKLRISLRQRSHNSNPGAKSGTRMDFHWLR